MLENTLEYQNKDAIIDRYRVFVDIDDIRKNSKHLTHRRILHLNSVTRGGGVAAILSNIIPVFKSLELHVDWFVPDIDDKDFFMVTKRQHNMLQGIDNGRLSIKEKEIYWNIQKRVAEELREGIDDYDLIVIHDTQYAGVIKYLKDKGKARWIYRCHIDTSRANSDVYEFFLPVIKMYDASLYHMKEFILPGSPFPKILLPSIDPFDPKNDPEAVTNDYIKSTISEMGLDYNRPILLQVGRFDPAKGFETMCDVYKDVKKRFTDVQLLLTGAGAKDDPEFYKYIGKIKSLVEDYKDAVVKELPFDILKLNAVQQAGSIVYALSKREGFGLVVSEAAIKERPVIVTNVGGLTVQVIDGETGFIVSDVKEAVEKTCILLENADLRRKMGEEGRRYILSRFITPIHVNNYLKIFREVLGD